MTNYHDFFHIFFLFQDGNILLKVSTQAFSQFPIHFHLAGTLGKLMEGIVELKQPIYFTDSLASE